MEYRVKKTYFSKLIIATVAVLGIVLLNACSPNRNILEQVQHSGELHILTRNAATTYYAGPHGPAGLEYDLVKAFADSLHVELELIVKQNIPELFSALLFLLAIKLRSATTETTARTSPLR